jgi:hypothetical protein
MTLGVDADYVHEQYERVRREATTADPTKLRGHGLALFMSRGMSAWLAVIQTLVPPRPVRSERTDTVVPLDRVAWHADDRTELTHVLASLVLTCVPEVVRR